MVVFGLRWLRRIGGSGGGIVVDLRGRGLIVAGRVVPTVVIDLSVGVEVIGRRRLVRRLIGVGHQVPIVGRT